MPIISTFPNGSGSGGSGGLALAAVTGIETLTAAGKVYVKWTDPNDLVVAGSTLATWGGTKLIRKAGSPPVSRRDGVEVLDCKERNKYQNAYFCDSGLTDGETYYYKFFPYTTQNAYTDSPDDEFSAVPAAVPVGNVSGMSAVAAGNGKLAIKWTDPAATVVSDGVTLATWANTVVVVKAGSYATDPDDSNVAYRKAVTTRNQYASNPLTVTGLTNGKVVNYQCKVVVEDGLNCRTTYSTAGDVLTTYPAGTMLTITKEQSGWGYTGLGWVYLMYTERISTTTETEADFMNDQNKFNEMFANMRKALQDNDAGKWSEAAREWAISTGLIAGNGTTINGEPNCMWADFLTREQLVTVLYRFAQMMGKA